MHQSNIAHLKKNVAPFEKTDTKSSIRQLINTIGPLLLLWYGAYLSLSVSYWLTSMSVGGWRSRIPYPVF